MFELTQDRPKKARDYTLTSGLTHQKRTSWACSMAGLIYRATSTLCDTHDAIFDESYSSVSSS